VQWAYRTWLGLGRADAEGCGVHRQHLPAAQRANKEVREAVTMLTTESSSDVAPIMIDRSSFSIVPTGSIVRFRRRQF